MQVGYEYTPEELIAFKAKCKKEQENRYLKAWSFNVGDRVKIIDPKCLLYHREMDAILQGVIATIYSIDGDPKEFYCVTILLPELGVYLDTTKIRACPDGLMRVGANGCQQF